MSLRPFYAAMTKALPARSQLLTRLVLMFRDKLSIAGIDDFPLARKVWPSLTTVRQPMRRISGEATRLLFELIEGKTPEVTQICVEEELIIRSSTGPCRS